MPLLGLPAAGAPPRTPGYFSQDKGKGFLTFVGEPDGAVQGGIPMTVQGKGAALPPCKRPEARRPTRSRPPAFILAANIPAGGSRRFRRATGAGTR
jgi:hypothetical protein